MTDQKLLAALRWLGLSSGRSRWFGFVLFHAFLVVGLFLAVTVLPDRSANTRPTKVEQDADMVVYRYRHDRVDPRGIRGLDEALANDDDLVIAWVSGSTVVLGSADTPSRDRTFLPAHIGRLLTSATDQRVRVNMFQLTGASFADVFVAAEAALSLEPDLLVLTGNPVWIANDLVVSRYPNFDQAFAGETLTDPALFFPLGLASAQPGETLLSAVGSVYSDFADYPDMSSRVRRVTESLDFLDSVPPPRVERAVAPGLPELFEKSRNDYAGFWWFVGAQWRDRQAETGYRLADGGSIAESLLIELVQDANDAEVPMYVYLAPTDLGRGPDAAHVFIDEKEAFLASLGDQFSWPGFGVSPDIMNERFPEITFRDRWHVDDPAGMPVFLADQICAQLKAAGESLDCDAIEDS